MQHPNGFYVWNPKEQKPKQQHLTLVRAIEESERLAITNPGAEFFVLEVKGISKIDPPPRIFKAATFLPNINDSDDLPF